jgi:starvation-inducible outer membrane lipoprotein
MKGHMKIVILALSLAGLVVGCATSNNGMGGTSDQYASEQYPSDNVSGRYHSNAANGTGTVTATNMDREGISQ